MTRSEQDIIAEGIESLFEGMDDSDDPTDKEVRTMKAASDRRMLVMQGKQVGGLLGHVDKIPKINLDDMSVVGDGHHAYVLTKRKGKHGISHHVTRRLGEFPSHEEALAAIKKFHKLEESCTVRVTDVATWKHEILAEGDTFSPRVKFNWGYHDAVAEFQRGKPRGTVEKGDQNMKTVSKQFNKHYYHGYLKGIEHAKADSADETSDRAWSEHREQEKKGAADRKALRDARPETLKIY